MSLVVPDLDHTAQILGLSGRLRQVPASAAVRGVFFNLIHDALKRRGLEGHPLWRADGGESRRMHAFYPARDLIRLSSTAGSIVDPSDPAAGMRVLHATTATYFASTWFGQAFRRFLKPDPSAALGWIERSRDHVANYGRWRYEPRGFGRGVLHMFDEYCFIETIQRGGCEGLLAACGVRGEVRVELDSPFVGRLLVAWEPIS